MLRPVADPQVPRVLEPPRTLARLLRGPFLLGVDIAPGSQLGGTGRLPPGTSSIWVPQASQTCAGAGGYHLLSCVLAGGLVTLTVVLGTCRRASSHNMPHGADSII